MMPSEKRLAEYRTESLTWIQNAHAWGGDFIKSFADACARADLENFRILEPALREMRRKYPSYEKNFGERHKEGV